MDKMDHPGAAGRLSAIVTNSLDAQAKTQDLARQPPLARNRAPLQRGGRRTAAWHDCCRAFDCAADFREAVALCEREAVRQFPWRADGQSGHATGQGRP